MVADAVPLSPMTGGGGGMLVYVGTYANKTKLKTLKIFSQNIKSPKFFSKYKKGVSMFSYEEYLEKLKQVEEKEEDEDILKLMIWKETFNKLRESIEASTSFK